MLSQEAAINDYVNNYLPTTLANIDKFHAENNGGKGYLVGDKVGYTSVNVILPFLMLSQA